MDRTERRLRDREERIRAEIDRRRSTSQRQADMALGRNQPDDENGADEERRRIPLSVSERQARLATGATS